MPKIDPRDVDRYVNEENSETNEQFQHRIRIGKGNKNGNSDYNKSAKKPEKHRPRSRRNDSDDLDI